MLGNYTDREFESINSNKAGFKIPVVEDTTDTFTTRIKYMHKIHKIQQKKLLHLEDNLNILQILFSQNIDILVHSWT